MDLPETPRIKSQFKPLVYAPDACQLRSHLGSVTIREEWGEGFLEHLIPLLDGHHTVEEILGALEEFDESLVIQTLRELAASGVIVQGKEAGTSAGLGEKEPRFDGQMAAFSNFSQEDGADFQRRLADSRVVILGLGVIGARILRGLSRCGVGDLVGIDAKRVTSREIYTDSWYDEDDEGDERTTVLAKKIRQAGPNVRFTPVQVEDLATAEPRVEIESADLVVLAFYEMRPDVYMAVNRWCLDTETKWTSCRLNGFEFNIGPTVIPYETPCYKCYELRKKSNLTSFEDYKVFEEYASEHGFVWDFLNVIPGCDLAALEVIKLLTSFTDPATYGHVVSLNLLTMESRTDTVLKLPRCPHCGKPAQEKPRVKNWQQARD
ncbi:MAG: TOMM precursor leader peptide-binding protein [Salinibacter sp.]